MKRLADLLRAERRARTFFALLAQSALGTGAGYVALLLVAYDRLDSPWAISLVLIADLLPPMVLGPILGAAADRWSRRNCMVIADVVRAIAFVGIALVDSFAATLALALLAGLGTALFTPASLAALPSLPVATSVYGAITDLGLAVGPAIMAAFLLIASPETILAGNALTFALSALVLARLSFGDAPSAAESTAARGTLLGQTRDGIRSIGLVRGLWPILAASAAGVFFGGLVNVAELPFLKDDLGATDAAFSAMVALVGAGIAAGSLAGGAGGELKTLTNRFTIGLLLSGAGFLVAGLVPTLAVVLVMFTLAGFGNGLMLVHERLFIQETVPDELTARVFGVRDATTAWGFGVAFVSAGALVSLAGPQTVIAIAGAGVTLVALAAGYFLRHERLVSAETAGSTSPVAAESP